jgi:MFS family permease
VQILLAGVSGTLLYLSKTNALTVEYLVGLTFVGGIGAALMGPTWQSIVPELVPRQDLKNAVALNSLGVNVARAVGPAAGGLLLASFGAAMAYGADVLSYVFVIAALLWWKRAAGRRHRPVRAVLRRVPRRPALCARQPRAARGAAARRGVLPVRQRRVGPAAAGVAAHARRHGRLLWRDARRVGAGAILGALLLPRLRQRLDADGLVLLASLLSAVVMGVLALAPPQWVAVLLMLVLGAGWIIALTTLNGVAQAVLPNWVRGRGLAIYLMVFNGAMAGGSLGWGLMAQEIGIPAALLVAAWAWSPWVSSCTA